MIISKFTPPFWGNLALAALTLTLTFASCSNDEDDSRDTKSVICPAVPPVYVISDTERIAFTDEGIAYQYFTVDKNRWVLSYQEIAERLGLDISLVKTIHITRDQILSNGLWRFDVRFDGQKEGAAYAIDVDPEDGEIEWVISQEEMPGGSVFVLKIN